MKDVFTTTELAERWSCDPQRIRDLAREKKLVGFKLGTRNYRFTLEEVQRFERESKAA